ncbi:unnamed protein product [Enterobius vermicularis]|uniref:FERM domain-containing protein n=1 Tax=Enterobius vermicularis TaxID=51028 RepID=A0A0N4VII5_ENTVE|nr:unnamed protein product [Enterobius vermicularis]
MNEGRRTIIHLLDGQKLEIVVQPRLFVEELLNIAASHVSLKDPDKQYFGIAYVDELFFVDSVVALYHPSTVELYFYDTQAQLCRSTLELRDLEYYKAVAYFLQIFDGDFTTEERARSLLSAIKMPKHFVKLYGVSSYTCEDNILAVYKEIVGTPRGDAILKFMQIAERSPTYGSHFYQARDKAGTPWAVAINSRGIYQYNMNDLSKPKKAFNWRFLDNLYYRDRKFTIEVRDYQRHLRVSRSSGDLNSIFGEDLDSEDELAKAAFDPTTNLSVTRRAAPSSVHVHVFFCESAFVCKTLWSAAIAQHQFYLDQRANFSSKVC